MTNITFLLPAYKAQYFQDALISIKNQTYSDFSCLVSDDCSPEDLKTIFDQTVGEDSRFSYRRNEQNMGSKSLVSHWNLLVGLCETKYLIMASDDDVYSPRFLEKMMLLADKYPQVELLRARCRIINAESVTLREDALSEEFESQDVFLYRFWAQRISCVANYMFRTEALKKQGKFVDFPLAWGSDTATVLNLCKKGVASPSEILFSFRSSGSNISTTQDAHTIRLKHKAYFQLYDFLFAYFQNWHPDNMPVCHYHYEVAKKSFMNLMYDLTINQWVYTPRELWTHFHKIRKLGWVTGKVECFYFFLTYIFERKKKMAK